VGGKDGCSAVLEGTGRQQAVELEPDWPAGECAADEWRHPFAEAAAIVAAGWKDRLVTPE
jgi:hypothetical protein